MTRRQLALLYFPGTRPEAAVRRLSRWIRNCTPLYDELNRNSRSFDHRQQLTIHEVRRIVYYLGEPEEPLPWKK